MDRLRLRNDIPGHTVSTATEDYAARGDDSTGRLVVGRDISLSGEIGACHDLVVEGTVKAELKDGVNMEIAETGLFDGSVEVINADISGRFVGTLVVRNQLVIRPSAEIEGTIEYGLIEVQPGARVNGSMTARPLENVEEIVTEEQNVVMMEEPVVDENPGALSEEDLDDALSQIEDSVEDEDDEDIGSLPFRRVRSN